MFLSHGYAWCSLEVRKTSVPAFVNPTADDLKIGPRRDRQLQNPDNDLPILCWDLKALPTHHLPWAGFSLGQSHWLILKARFH